MTAGTVTGKPTGTPASSLRLALIQPRQIRSGVAHRRQEYAQLIEDAAQSGADLALLPEDLLGAIDEHGTMDSALAEPIPGPFSQWLARLARTHRMWICACQFELEEGTLHNAAYLLDRDGTLVGKYRKVHEVEVYRRNNGVVAGDSFPVFDTEFGRVGMMTCFDNVFPESCRALALQGARLVLFPDASFHPTEFDVDTLIRARAIDNAVYFARSSYCVDVYEPGQWMGRSCLVGPDGLIRADAGRRPGVCVVQVDLSQGRSAYGYGTFETNDVWTRILIERRPEAYGVLSTPTSQLAAER